MSGIIYLKNRLPFLLVNLLCMIGLSVFLLVSGSRPDSICFILLVWAVILASGVFYAFWKRRRQLNRLLDTAGQLVERYLISEIMEKPEQAEDLVYYQLLRLAGKSMLEQTAGVRREQLEYKEYIEQWIHEVKTPVTAIRLLCENNRSHVTNEILVELEKVRTFMEQALYYARCECAEKDYAVREIRIFDVVHEAIADHKRLLLQYKVKIRMDETQDLVYSDDKWIRFILSQLIVNAVKYRSGEPVLSFSAERRAGQVILSVRDNGIGICESDLPRIFEKGFTGQNGRQLQQSTGIGLYLCSRLCDKLGIGITAGSGSGGTVIRLSFRVNHFISQVQR